MKIRAPNRRVVSNKKRKKALFSCDYCKIKKIACQRDNENGDIQDACIPCGKKNLKCSTSLKRKKKDLLPLENIGLHYQCLLSLLKGLYPDEDVNNIDVLIQIGKRLNIKMPDREGLGMNEIKGLSELAVSLTSSKRLPAQSKLQYERINNEIVGPSSDLLSIEEVSVTDNRDVEKDTHLIDAGGNRHYIGPFGAPSYLLTLTNDIISKNNYFFSPSIENCNKVFFNTHPISSVKNETDQNSSSNLFINPPITKVLADDYVNIFFDKIHPFFYCFNEQKFRSKQHTYWKLIKTHKINKETFPKVKICVIYMVWILGSLYYPVHSDKENENFIKYCLSTIDYFIPELLITPSTESIQFMILYSAYCELFGRKESGYVLLEVALSQAKSIGLHRKSLIKHLNSPDLVEELVRTWWTIFQYSIRINTQMGRMLNFPVNQITINMPTISDLSSIPNPGSWLDSIAISMDFHPVLELRSKIISSGELLLEHNLRLTVEIKSKMIAIFEKLPYARSNNINNYESFVLLLYHYYALSLSFPFLLLITKEKIRISPQDFILDIIQFAFDSSYSIFIIAELREKKGYSNGIFSPDSFIVYNAVMCLVAGDIWLKQCEEAQVNDINLTISNFDGIITRGILKDWFHSFKNFVELLEQKTRGTQYIISSFTSVFLAAVTATLDNTETNLNLIDDYLGFWKDNSTFTLHPFDGEAILRFEDFT